MGGCTPFALAALALALAGPAPAAAGTSSAAVPSAARAPAVTAISPAEGGAGDNTQVTIHGSGFTGVKSVLFGSAPATKVDVVSSSDIVALGPASGAGRVQVRVVTAHGTSPAVRAGRFTFQTLPRSSLSWATPFRVAGNGGGYPAGVSCPDTRYCEAVDADGDVITWNGTAWSAPIPGLPSAVHPVSLSCPTRTWCAAVGGGDDGHVWIGHGHAWTSFAPGGFLDWTSVSCVSTAFCMLATNDGWVSEYNGTTWSAPADVDLNSPDNGNFTVSCGARTLCVGMDDAGTAYWWNGTDWTLFDTTIGDGNGGQQVSCASATFCMAIDTGDVAWTWSGGQNWTDTGQKASVLGNLSCTATTFCMLVGLYADRWNGHKWTKSPKPVIGARPSDIPGGHTTAVGCAGQTCAAVSTDPNGGAAIFKGGGWGREVTIDNNGELDVVSCPSASFCAAVGVSDDAVVARHGRWQAPAYVANAPGLESVSCTSATFCLASDLRDGTWRFNGKSWSRAPAVPGALSAGERVGWIGGDVSCASPRFCVWAGVGLSVFNGTKWTPLAWSGGDWSAVSCGSRTLCVAGDFGGDVSVFNGRSWSRPRPADLNPVQVFSVSCARTRFCAVADGGGVATFNGSLWGYTQFSPELIAVSCTSSRFCAAADGAGGAYTFNGTLWSQRGSLPASPAGEAQTGIACTSASSCVLSGDHGDVMLGR